MKYDLNGKKKTRLKENFINKYSNMKNKVVLKNLTHLTIKFSMKQ